MSVTEFALSALLITENFVIMLAGFGWYSEKR